MATSRRSKAKSVRQATPKLQISVEGFKSISRRLTLEFRPLTVLSGANSSGKSSFMQPLLMLKQTLEAPYDPGALLINGPHVKFTSTKQFLSELSGHKRAESFALQAVSEDYDIELRFTRQQDRPIDLTAEIVLSEDERMTLQPGAKFGEPFSGLPSQVKRMAEALNTGPIGAPKVRVQVYRDRCFLKFGLWFRDDEKRFEFPLGDGMLGGFPELVRSLIHLPGLRGNPERTYPLSAISSGSFPGPYQNYAASVISQLQEQDNPALHTLNQYLQELGLASQITTRRVDETQVEVVVDRHITKEGSWVSIADVGMAVSQILPVLVALATAEKGQMVFIEQPELHLHPRAQLTLARIISAAIERGIILVVETHSSLLLLGIQTCIAEDLIDEQNVALHWFSRDKDGASCVQTAYPDATGSFGDWPEDFADVSLEAEHLYLSAVERVVAKHR